MRHKRMILVIIIISSFTLSLLIFNKRDVSVIKYFPIDETMSFIDYGTNLQLISETDKDEYDLDWNAFSELDKKIYLRQDISLLYSDGKLKGILSKWKEGESNIWLNTSIHGEDSSHFQTISFHHGEIHYPDDEIKSIQAMSYDQLYVIDSPHSALESFEQPSGTIQQEWKGTLDHATNQQLSYHWKQLIKYFEILQDNYVFTPLTELYKYGEEPIPTLTQEETKQVIGQLWEGLYKNYVLNITNNKKAVNSLIPLILFDKQGKHLIVLFQDAKGEKQQLIQYYPSSTNR